MDIVEVAAWLFINEWVVSVGHRIGWWLGGFLPLGRWKAPWR